MKARVYAFAKKRKTLLASKYVHKHIFYAFYVYGFVCGILIVARIFTKCNSF